MGVVPSDSSPKKRAGFVPFALAGVFVVGFGVPIALYYLGAFTDPPPRQVAPKQNVDVAPDPVPAPKLDASATAPGPDAP